jgi:hypothetical protein
MRVEKKGMFDVALELYRIVEFERVTNMPTETVSPPPLIALRATLLS